MSDTIDIDYYHNIEEDLSFGMIKGDRVLKHVQQQRKRIKELEAKLAKAVECIEEWQSSGCPYCPGDCSGANPPVSSCIMQMTRTTLEELKGGKG